MQLNIEYEKETAARHKKFDEARELAMHQIRFLADQGAYRRLRMIRDDLLHIMDYVVDGKCNWNKE